MTPAGPARVHSTLLAYDAVRAAGDDEAATKRLDQAMRVTAADVRAPITRAARALARGETTSAALRLPENAELAPIAEAHQPGSPPPRRGRQGGRRLRAQRQRASLPGPPGARQRRPGRGRAARGEAVRRGRALRRCDLAGRRARRRPPDAPRRRRPLAGAARGARGRRGPSRAHGACHRAWRQRPRRRVARERRLLRVRRAGRPVVAHRTAHRADRSPSRRDRVHARDETPRRCGRRALDARGGRRAHRPVAARAQRAAGSPESRALVQIGRLLASSAPPGDVEASLEGLGDGKHPWHAPSRSRWPRARAAHST